MKSLICLALIVCGVSFALAQPKDIGKEEFDAVEKAGGMQREKWAGKKYRMTTGSSLEMTDMPEFNRTFEFLMETGTNGDDRTVIISTANDKTKRSETISIGNWTYWREDADSWKRKERKPPKPQSPGSGTENFDRSDVLSSNTEYKYLGEGSIKGQIVRIYQKITREKRMSKSSTVSWEYEIRRKYWVNADGLAVRDELVSMGRSDAGRTTKNAIVSEWELDPTLTIVEPEVTIQP